VVLEVAQVGPPVEVGRVPDLGSFDDRPQLLAPLRDHCHGSTGMMDAPGHRSIVEFVEPFCGRDQDARHLTMLSPWRGPIPLDRLPAHGHH
jgi:hypothetical protein